MGTCRFHAVSRARRLLPNVRGWWICEMSKKWDIFVLFRTTGMGTVLK